MRSIDIREYSMTGYIYLKNNLIKDEHPVINRKYKGKGNLSFGNKNCFHFYDNLSDLFIFNRFSIIRENSIYRIVANPPIRKKLLTYFSNEIVIIDVLTRVDIVEEIKKDNLYKIETSNLDKLSTILDNQRIKEELCYVE